MQNIKFAVAYLRTSTDEQNPMLQLPSIQKYCDSHNLILEKTYVETKSGYKDESKREEFNNMIEFVKSVRDRRIVVVNMDRFSRQPEDEVLKLTKLLSSMYNVHINAVEGDAWSEIVESVGKFKEMGFIGDALSEFLEKVLRGLEHQRAYRESKTKSDRVKRAIKRVNGVTLSYRGKKWGDKSLPKQTRDRIIQGHLEGKTIRQIAEVVKTTDKHGNMKPIGKSVVHKYIQQYLAEKNGLNQIPQVN